MNPDFLLVSYGAAATAFGILAVLLITVWRKRVRGSVLTVAVFLSVFWAAAVGYYGANSSAAFTKIYFSEISFDLVWLFFLSSMLGNAVARESNWLVRHGGVVLGLVLVVAGLAFTFTELRTGFPSALGQMLVMGSIATSLYALVGIEQLFRNARPVQQNGLKFLCLGLATIFAYDLFLYSNAVVGGQIQPQYWGARGFIVAICVPVIAISVPRIPSWQRGIFASRKVVFYTTTLFAAGMYLMLIGLVGYYIKAAGKEWGDALQLIFFSAATLGLLSLLLSEQLRARTRVFLTKHFFERKYDYRAEWLRLIDTLTSTIDDLPLRKRAIKALAQIVESPSGHLWLHDGDSIVAVAGWDTRPIVGEIDAASDFATFLGEKGWIIEFEDVERWPDRYQPVTLAAIPAPLAEATFVVPLIHEARLFGFISLSSPRTPTSLNFEDHDLLKTAGQQIASYLAQEESTEQLAESRQFEAYNQFTAFVMHDLKNAIAQQSLVVENAERHKRNPEFIDDAMEAIKGSVERMRRVMGHLRQSAIDQPKERVDVSKLLAQAESQCSDREPVPVATASDKSIIVYANKERLVAALIHAVRNAQDATDADGQVSLSVSADYEECRIKITDTGAGMEASFIREHLFKPFDSTKGAEGMGIGAYQIRETIRACGGDIDVHSVVGEGTTMTLRIPLASEAPG